MKLRIETHDGEEDIIEVEEYDVQETADIINGVKKNEDGNAYNVVVLGEGIYSCINIKNIRPVGDE